MSGTIFVEEVKGTPNVKVSCAKLSGDKFWRLYRPTLAAKELAATYDESGKFYTLTSDAFNRVVERFAVEGIEIVNGPLPAPVDPALKVAKLNGLEKLALSALPGALVALADAIKSGKLTAEQKGIAIKIAKLM